MDCKPKTWEERLVLFVGYLIENKKKSSTIKSYISAIKAVLKEDGEDLNENSFLLTSLTRACKFENDQVKTQLPIRKGLVKLLIESLPDIYGKQEHPYLTQLFRTMFITAYFGLFRIGEIAQSPHVVRAKDVHIGLDKNKLMFVLHTSKTHWKDTKPQIVKITGSESNKQCAIAENCKPFAEGICPFQFLKQYLAMRGSRKSDDEQFFVFSDGSAVKPEHLRSVLKKTLIVAGLNPRHYSVHGFRGGRTCDLVFSLHLDIAVVKKLGRWRSSAVYTYLKQQ